MKKQPKFYSISALVAAVAPLLVVIVESGSGTACTTANVAEYYNTPCGPRPVGHSGDLSFCLAGASDGFNESLAELSARCKVTLIF